MSFQSADVSVVIPTYNRCQLLARALDSVFGQSVLASEVIVIDDGSTDNTAELVTKVYPEVQYHRIDHKGVSAARNVGIDRATSEWIAFLDSDDVWKPQKLQRQIAALESHPECVICHTEEEWIRDGQPVTVPTKYRKQAGWIFEKSLRHCAISPSTALIKRKIFRQIGSFDTALPVCEDYELWLRMTARFPVLLVDEPLIEKHGGHADQLSTSRWGFDRYRVQGLNQFIQFGVLSFEQRNAAIEALRAMCEIVRKGALKHQNKKTVTEMEALLALY